MDHQKASSLSASLMKRVDNRIGEQLQSVLKLFEYRIEMHDEVARGGVKLRDTSKPDMESKAFDRRNIDRIMGEGIEEDYRNFTNAISDAASRIRLGVDAQDLDNEVLEERMKGLREVVEPHIDDFKASLDRYTVAVGMKGVRNVDAGAEDTRYAEFIGYTAMLHNELLGRNDYIKQELQESFP